MQIYWERLPLGNPPETPEVGPIHSALKPCTLRQVHFKATDYSGRKERSLESGNAGNVRLETHALLLLDQHHVIRAKLLLAGSLRMLAHPLLLKAAHSTQAPSGEHGLVIVPARCRRRQHLVAREDGVGAGEKGEGLLGLGEEVAPGSEADDRGGKDQASCSDGPHHSLEVDRLLKTHQYLSMQMNQISEAHLVVLHRSTRNAAETVDGETLWVLRETRHFPDETNAIFALFAQPKDTSGAHGDACISNVGDRLEAVIV